MKGKWNHTLPNKIKMASEAIEVPWVDAWIRWERYLKETYDDVVNVNEESLPPPTDNYTFTYPVPNMSEIISLDIKGFQSVSEQTWNSTGLTLWRSSYYLCQHLVDHHEELLTAQNDSMKILEVGSGLGRCGMLSRLLSKTRGNETQTILTDGDTDTLKQLRIKMYATTLETMRV